jgi:hypothetical protein
MQSPAVKSKYSLFPTKEKIKNPKKQVQVSFFI